MITSRPPRRKHSRTDTALPVRAQEYDAEDSHQDKTSAPGRAQACPNPDRLQSQAFDRQPLAEYAIALGDIALRQGDTEAARRADELVRAIDRLAIENGVDTDLEFALFLVDRGDTPGGVERARAAYEKRPSIHAADALAWALFRSGDVPGAYEKSQEALRLGTRDHIKLFHAGLIAKAAGQPAEAREHLELVANLSPQFSVLHEDEGRETLAELRAMAIHRARSVSAGCPPRGPASTRRG